MESPFLKGRSVTKRRGSHLYDFKQLSPADFEDLTRDLLQRHWRIHLEVFKTGRDKGIDFRYAAADATIVQCKHFVGSSTAKLIHHIQTSEYPKVVQLNPQRYVLVTSLPLSPTDKDKINAALRPYIINMGDIIGAGDLNNLIGLHSDIENQHFKLWMSSTVVLQRVLYNAAHVQTN